MSSNDTKISLSAGKVAKTAAEFFLAILLCMTLFVFTVALIARSTLSTSYTISRIPSTYCKMLFDEIETTVDDYTFPTGLDTSVLDDVITQEQVEIDFNSCIRNPYPGSGFSLDTSQLEEKLNHNVINYLENLARNQAAEAEKNRVDAEGLAKVPINGDGSDDSEEENTLGTVDTDGNVTLNEETLAAVDEYVKEIGDLYRKNIRMPGLDYLAGLGEEYAGKFIFCLIVPVFVAVLLGFLLIRLQMDANKSLRYFAYAIGGTAAMCILGPLFILIWGGYRHLGITPFYFNNFMVAYINGILIQFFVTAAVWVVITAALTVVVMRLESRAERAKTGERDMEEEDSEEDDSEEEDSDSEEDDSDDEDSDETDSEDFGKL